MYPQSKRSGVLPLVISLVHDFPSSPPLDFPISWSRDHDSTNLATSRLHDPPDFPILRFLDFPISRSFTSTGLCVFVSLFDYYLLVDLDFPSSLILPISRFLYISISLSFAISLSFYPVSLLLFLASLTLATVPYCFSFVLSRVPILTNLTTTQPEIPPPTTHYPMSLV